MIESSFPRRALIPCGGRGTRMSSLTQGGTKELLPVAGVPVAGRALMECAASGIGEGLGVSAPGKHDLDDYVMRAAGRAGMPSNVRVVTQTEARGLADAIRLGR